jgi:hypothetical protein
MNFIPPDKFTWQAGADFFIFKDGSGNTIDLDGVEWSDPSASGLSAANIFVNSDIQNDVSAIAASKEADNLTGKGDNALAIANLKKPPIYSLQVQPPRPLTAFIRKW